VIQRTFYSPYFHYLLPSYVIQCMLFQVITRSSAVAGIANHTAYSDSDKMLPGISMVGMSIYLFTVSDCTVLLTPVSFLAGRRVLWLNDTSYSKSSEEVNRKCPARNMTVLLSVPYTNPEDHNARHLFIWKIWKLHYRQMSVSCQYC